jgi:hypothetical protein
VRASGSPRGENSGSAEAGRRKKGGSSSHREQPEVVTRGKGVLVGRSVSRGSEERRKGALAPFVPKRLTRRGGRKGGPARARRTAREGPGGAETQARRGRRRAGGTGDAGVEQGKEAPTGGPARRLGPRCRDREEGRDGDGWAQFFKFNPNSMIQTV